MLIPFLVSRQIICGAGKVVHDARGAPSTASASGPTTSGRASPRRRRARRPIINTRDEPHADAEKYRRLHVIVGDSNMSETTTLLKVGSADLVLRMIEAGMVMRDLTLENPIRAIREMSHDMTGRKTVRLANGRELSALQIQREYLERAQAFADREGLDDADPQAGPRPVGAHPRRAVDTGNLSLVDTEIDWVIKHRLIDRLHGQARPAAGRTRGSPSSTSPTTTSTAERGLFYLLQQHGRAARVATDPEIFEAKTVPPQTTRAKLRGDFIKAAQEHRRDFTVDWVHLKLNDQAQRTVLCKDPFAAVDARVDRLIEGMRG